MTGTVEISQQQQEDAEFAAARHEEIAAICWRVCRHCSGRGFNVEHLEGDPHEYILKATCPHCKGQGEMQLHDPWRVEALYDAADDARETLGEWCYTRISKALGLAVNGAVTLEDDGYKIKGKAYTITPQGCNCLDAHYKAPKIDNIPRCKHLIAVHLVQAAEWNMFDQEPTHYGPWSDVLDGLISGQEADRREVSGG